MIGQRDTVQVPAIDDEVLQGGFVTCKQAAEILGVSAKHVIRMTERGELPYLALAPEKAYRAVRRISRKHILEYIERHMRWGR